MLYIIQKTASQCLVVWVSIDLIDPSLDETDWEGTYIMHGSTPPNCPSFSTFDGKTLRYTPNSWTLSSISNDPLSYPTTDTSPPCDPPLGTNGWEHGITSINDSIVTITCSITSNPSKYPSTDPTQEPTFNPSLYPTRNPSLYPTFEPTINPTTSEPTSIPTIYPTFIPSIDPTIYPTSDPIPSPTKTPTYIPSSPPVPSPTLPPSSSDCSRIVVLLRSPLDETPSSIDGIYYIRKQSLFNNGYPWYLQKSSGTEINPSPTNHVEIYWKQGYWNIVDITNDIQLQYQQNNPSPTDLIPPHTAITGNPWIDVNVNDVITWQVLITCGPFTNNPTTNPTIEPTKRPSEYPTYDPTIEPTIIEPTFYPTTEPTIETETSQETSGGEAQKDTFLDALSVLEWIIIAALLLICCLVICSLCIWRNSKIDAAKKEQDAHNLKVNMEEDELEMASNKNRRNGATPSLDFGDTHKRMSTPINATQKTPIKQYNDKDVEADFADALAVVSSHKSQNSLYNSYKNENNALNSDENSGPSSATSPLIGKQDSNFYGNHPIDDIYSYTFITKPFGMEWKTTKADKKNLYVSKVNPGSQASMGSVKVGSKLISFNGEMIEDMGAKNIYGKLAMADMPLTITFLKPFQKEQDKEGDNYMVSPKSIDPVHQPPISMSQAAAASDDNKLKMDRRDTTPPAPHSPNISEIPPDAVPPPVDTNKNNADYAIDGGYASDNGGRPLIPPAVPPIPADEDDPFQEIGPPPVPTVPTDDVNDGTEPKKSFVSQQMDLIPQVFDDGDNAVDQQESFHAE